MAIWQCSIQLIPDAVVSDNPNGIEIRIGEEGLDTTGWWLNHQPVNSWSDIIEKYFPPCDSWSEEILMWGEEDQIQFQSCITGPVVEEIGVRIDARHLDEDGMRRMIEVVAELCCHIYFMETQDVIRADYQEFAKHLRKSRAVAYVKNPRQCLEQIAKDQETQQKAGENTSRPTP